MQSFTILNTRNWQKVEINLSKINLDHVVNIHLTLENGQLAVLFKLGDIMASRDNKILCQTFEESKAVLALFVARFPYLLQSFSHIAMLFGDATTMYNATLSDIDTAKIVLTKEYQANFLNIGRILALHSKIVRLELIADRLYRKV